jgi:NAD(P)-dependent dehydrogenase (short-subunit alcohol dehydrogenase family)
MQTQESKITSATSGQPTPALLLIAASRGLGLAMAEEFLKKGWRVTGTVRENSNRAPSQALADQYPGQLEIETLEVNDQQQLADLRQRLSGKIFQMLFVNAGITNDPAETIGEVTTEEFTRIMVTNALSPMRVIESLQHLVTPDGLIGVMSSGLGSIANNTTGMYEVYRGSKSALNQFMRSYAARTASTPRPMVVVAPGWVRTDMGGPNATLGIEESIPKVVEVLLAKQGKPGLEYLNYQGQTVPW